MIPIKTTDSRWAFSNAKWIFCDRAQIVCLSRFYVQNLCNLGHVIFSDPDLIADPYKPSLLFIHIFEFVRDQMRLNMLHALPVIVIQLSSRQRIS
jgi:hypothetical protein